MNRDAIFSDGTREFRTPWEPKRFSRVKIRVRVGHGADTSVSLVTRDYELPMQLDDEGEVFDYYKTMIQLSADKYEYCFKVQQDGECVYYDRYGVTDDIRWQYAFAIVPNFSTPDWAKGAVIYQIFTDRFYNGDPGNDVLSNEYYYVGHHSVHVDNWDAVPDNLDVSRFYGGDLEGVRQKLNYLKSLGVDVIYFNPLFVSPSNHKYDCQDYDNIDPHYGVICVDDGEVLKNGDTDNRHATKFIRRVTDRRNLDASNRFFADFVKEAHEKGIRVIIDGVFNHCGSFNKWMDRERIYEGQPGYPEGAFIKKDSPYHDFFAFYNNDDRAWPYNASYDSWWGNDTLPKLNYEGSEDLCEYILQIGRKWVSEPYNCDGWRLDVAADLGHSEEFNHNFWKRFRKAVKEANPNAVILAEHYGDATSWLQGDQWDTIMNYDAFMEPVSWFMTGMEKHSEEFDGNALGDGTRFEAAMRHHMSTFLTPSLMCSMNQLDNHDHSRFLTRTNHKVGRISTLGSAAAGEDINKLVYKTATLLQMTWPGAPTLYYGDEAGQVGFTDPDNRRTYPWGHEDGVLMDFTRDMISLHKTSPAIRWGAFVFLKCERNLVSYGRFTRDQQVVVAINAGSDILETDIPVWKAEVPMDGMMEQVMVTNEKAYSIMPVQIPVHNGYVHLSLQPYAGVVLERDF